MHTVIGSASHTPAVAASSEASITIAEVQDVGDTSPPTAIATTWPSSEPASNPAAARIRAKLLALGDCSQPLHEAITQYLATQPNERGLIRQLLLIVPYARKAMLESQDLDDKLTGIEIGALRACYDWFDLVDPMASRILDLRYFANLGIKQIASILDYRPNVVLRELRFLKQTINIRL